MTHALHLPILAADGDRVPFHADPVLAVIEAHSEGWAVFQAAPGGEPALRAEDASDAALMALLGTACATRAGMFCLIRHLRWFLTEEAPNAEGHDDAWAIAQAREADLSRCLGVERIERLPSTLPLGRLITCDSARWHLQRKRRRLSLAASPDAPCPSRARCWPLSSSWPAAAASSASC